MNNFRVTLLGRLRFENGSTTPIDIQGRKAQELLCYLLIFRHQPHLRERLALLLWREKTSTQSKSYLRRTLWHLQQTLDTCAPTQQPLLLVDSDLIQLNSEASFWLDVAELERVYQLVEGVPGEDLNRRTAQIVHDTVALYGNELLLGWYQPWCIYERERLQHIYLIMLDKLMRHCEARGDFEKGIAYGRQILRCDQAREYTHRQLMRLFHLARDRTSALRQYAQCVSALREELDVEPTQRTRQLYQQIRQDKVTLRQSALHHNGQIVEHAERMSLRCIQSELTQMQSDLDVLSQRVTHTTVYDNVKVALPHFP